MAFSRIAVSLLALSAALAGPAGAQPRTAGVRTPVVVAIDSLAVQVAVAVRLVERVAVQPAPRDLAPAAAAEYASQTAWLGTVRDRLAAHLRTRNAAFGDTPLGGGMVAEMTRMNREFLELQTAIQTEARRFRALSNASRVRHDVVLNAIRNLKA